MSLININNVSKNFAGVQALKNVNMSIEPGEIRCLAGENGSGKSTLIKIISGVHKPDDGNIEINNKPYKSITPIDAIQEGIQVIYQDFSIFPNLTVAENISLNIELFSGKKYVNWNHIKKVAKEALDNINNNIDLAKKVEELSVAEKQLVAISRALLHNAKLIIMDEPTTALTQKEVNSLFKIITKLKETGISVLFVSHKLEELYRVCEKITILRNGTNVFDGNICDINKEQLIYYMTGRIIQEDYFKGGGANNKTILTVENLSQKGGFKEISFDLKEGEILGITGLLGSGRTSLAKALFGINKAESGQIKIDGEKVRINSTRDAIKNKIAYVPEDRLTEGLFLDQSIGRNIIVSVLDRFLSKFKLLKMNELKNEIDSSISDLNIITPSHLLPVKTLSGGNQQRVVLSKWLSTKPRILILNGPTVGIDIGSKADIYSIIRKMALQGVGIIIISDDLPEVLQNCKRILVMKNGRIVSEFNSNEVSEEQLVSQLGGR